MTTTFRPSSSFPASYLRVSGLGLGKALRVRLRQLSGFTFALQRFDFLGMLRPQVLRLSGCCAYSCPFAYSLSTGKRCCLNGQPKQCESQQPSAPQKNWKTPQPGKAPAGSTHGLLSIPGFIKGSLEWSPLAGALLLQGFYKGSLQGSCNSAFQTSRELGHPRRWFCSCGFQGASRFVPASSSLRFGFGI